MDDPKVFPVSQLIFFDTFAHLGSEDANIDLVRFDGPVRITDIRIIPLGSKIEADFPGGLRLGATNPSSIQLKFFINDLRKTNGAFVNAGLFSYQQDSNIQYVVPEHKATDSLIVEGSYSTLTLAVFGEKIDAKSLAKPATPLPSPVREEERKTEPEDAGNLLAQLDPQKSLAVLDVIEKCIMENKKSEGFTPEVNSEPLKTHDSPVLSQLSFLSGHGTFAKDAKKESPRILCLDYQESAVRPK
ncbi:Protein virilizer [Halotydeus destructor]|nr:Protein virilizer [Halotydeus destructor]